MNVTIIGLGLIGGSFGLALRKYGLAERIYGVEASERNAHRALELGLVDEIVEFERALEVADVVSLTRHLPSIYLGLTAKP